MVLWWGELIFLDNGSCSGSRLGGVRENPCAIKFKNTKQRAARLTLTEERKTILLFLGEARAVALALISSRKSNVRIKKNRKTEKYLLLLVDYLHENL